MEKLSDCGKGKKMRSERKKPIGLNNDLEFNRNDVKSGNAVIGRSLIVLLAAPFAAPGAVAMAIA